MGLYNFQKRFVPFILEGRKTHTIRMIRANPDVPGNTLHLYTGLRTKKAKLLMRVPCRLVEEIDIWDHYGPEARDANLRYGVRINGLDLDASEKQALARRDGFSNFGEMMYFWTDPTNRLPFRGHIIYWQ